MVECCTGSQLPSIVANIKIFIVIRCVVVCLKEIGKPIVVGICRRHWCADGCVYLCVLGDGAHNRICGKHGCAVRFDCVIADKHSQLCFIIPCAIVDGFCRILRHRERHRARFQCAKCRGVLLTFTILLPSCNCYIGAKIIYAEVGLFKTGHRLAKVHD